MIRKKNEITKIGAAVKDPTNAKIYTKENKINNVNNNKPIGNKKKKSKKKKVPKDKIQKEEHVEITEKKELVENYKINTYDESDNKLLSHIVLYIKLREEEKLNELLQKYYKDNYNPLFYIECDIDVCIYNIFFTLSNSNGLYMDNKNDYMLLKKKQSIYFYNILNCKCLNTILYYLKEFFKDYKMDDFENVCETLQLTYFFFFLLWKDTYELYNNIIKRFCLDTFKIISMFKYYLYEKYISYKNKCILNKFVLLKKIESENYHNDFFSFENKVICNLSCKNEIIFEHLNIKIYSPVNLEKKYFISILIKNKSYEYIKDMLFLDLFQVHIITNSNLNNKDKLINTPNDISNICHNTMCNDLNGTIISSLNLKDNTDVLLLKDYKKSVFESEEKNNNLKYEYIIEMPHYIYDNDEIDVCFIEFKNKIKYRHLCEAEILLHTKNETLFVNPNMIKTYNGMDTNEYKEENKREEYFISSKLEEMNILSTHGEYKQDILTKMNDDICYDIKVGDNKEMHMGKSYENLENTKKKNNNNIYNNNNNNSNIYNNNINNNGYIHTRKSLNLNDEYESNLLYNECLINNNEINIWRVQNTKFKLNNKTYLKIHSKRIGNYYIDLNNIKNVPYKNWSIEFMDNIIIIKIINIMNIEFEFHITRDGILLMDNKIDILKDLYNILFDVPMLLLLMKKKGINFLVTNIEIQKMMSEKYFVENDETEQNIIHDILLCFKFMNFYSSNENLDNSKTIIKIKIHETSIMDKLGGILNEPIDIIYEKTHCKISIIERNEYQKKLKKYLTKHKSLLFCLFELCEYIYLFLDKKEKIIENNKHEKNIQDREDENQEDNKNDMKNLQSLLINIFNYNNIKKIKNVIKENDNNNNCTIPNENINILDDQYNDILKFNEMAYHFYLFLKLTKMVLLTNIYK
ncbi:hypothetical protein PFUGPA_04177 [Plasmodium falciparum Palo Alto/Uganda]|uniref:Uncharacterized protein n=7 Tax=Plasmodium falciparum TaxID=5833 RepID=Q8IKJ4_PLAF7|nr:conserved Plasmodium protein, unknown function [Plasmodium falciparum 3D7]ETW27547.1 hypothetical protein PFFCH_04997 [Plasmodium falciparum FCH/4]ETW39600.1 hypothetical protein PFNF135_05630 [Plasmodium falciparum NF135/5.C10]ETW46577.1 hypothetical protein PFMALIP_05480 [Plasmodium falciparum MaliPS096_E11]ETW54308.1 hypothetical protein PFUGPA_04177 [Plasmodium falciparum Palo Alto/Uganda]ETW58625.1 hypothetical protein PFMC_05722 [Plasmodium falciparum CAMP/Malaysia]EWC86227.1 hypothe|eukprot:XP_001348785.1 conserved Plasmodium protein, unknown function [Plasmodium falciparum 3D7]